MREYILVAHMNKHELAEIGVCREVFKSVKLRLRNERAICMYATAPIPLGLVVDKLRIRPPFGLEHDVACLDGCNVPVSYERELWKYPMIRSL